MQGCILFFSDIHADAGALDLLLKISADQAFVERFGAVEKIINLGDTVERGYNPCEIIDRLGSLNNLISVLGNHDEAFICQTPVSGSNEESETAHQECRRKEIWRDFFESTHLYWTDENERIYAVHGGPIDPGSITPKDADGLTAWLHSMTWQRISREGGRYFDWSGYHYSPEDAFAQVRKVLKPGFIIICGHEHSEAAYMEEDSGAAADILHSIAKATFQVRGKRIEEKSLALEEGRNYLVRLGIAGPAGYYQSFGWDRCYFGVYHVKDGHRTMSMLSFPIGRDATPP